MDSFTHYIPTPDTVFPSRTERSYTGYTAVPFNHSLTACDFFSVRPTSDRLRFSSAPTYAAYMAGTWADVFAPRD